MKLLHRYIVVELLKVFGVLLSVLTVLLTLVGAFDQVRQSGLGLLQVLRILPWIVPSLLPFTIPATFLLSVCVVYGRMAGDQEVTAVKAAGISVLSVLWPSFALSLILCVCSFLMTDQLIPLSVRKIQQAVTVLMEDIFLKRLKTQGQLTGWAPGLEITVMGVRDRTLLRPTIRYVANGKEKLIVQAREGTVGFDLEREQILLHFSGVYADILGHDTVWLEHADYAFPLPNKLRRTKVRHMSLATIQQKLDQLRTERQSLQEQVAAEAAMILATGEFEQFVSEHFRRIRSELEDQSSRKARYLTEIHSRFALAVSCFCFVLLGSPFSILQARRQFLTNFLLVFFPILLLYYPLVLLTMNLCKTGAANPAVAMWLGDVLIAAIGLIVLRRVMKH